MSTPDYRGCTVTVVGSAKEVELSCSWCCSTVETEEQYPAWRDDDEVIAMAIVDWDWDVLPSGLVVCGECSDARKCRVCGCSNHHACPGGCGWVEDDLCSVCGGREPEREVSR